MKHYTLKITPLDDFFFGDENLNASTQKADYYLKSNYLPQQTSILGLLRYVLLYKNGWLDFNKKSIDKSSVEDLIGTSSFIINNKNKFGIINIVSSLFLLKNNEPFYVSPFNTKYTIIKNDPFSLEHYKVKDEHFPLQFTNNGNNFISEDDIINKNLKPGNQKSSEGRTKEEGYYLQEFLRFNQSIWSFAVNISLDTAENTYENYSCIVPFGGEKKLFNVAFVPMVKENIPEYPKMGTTYYGLYLLSDAFLTNKEIDAADFCITKNRYFRNLVTNADTRSYATISDSETENKIYRTGLFNVCSKGSVFYFSNKDKRDNLYNHLNTLNGCNIGFNMSKTIN